MSSGDQSFRRMRSLRHDAEKAAHQGLALHLSKKAFLEACADAWEHARTQRVAKRSLEELPPADGVTP